MQGLESLQSIPEIGALFREITIIPDSPDRITKKIRLIQKTFYAICNNPALCTAFPQLKTIMGA